MISKPVVAAFDQEHSSSDGGALLLKAIDEKLGLSEQLAECLRDDRQAGKVRHDLSELVQQRMFAIALGYPDGNDANELADDPIHKMLIGRNPVHGDRLASQSTVSRFENAPGTVELYRLVETIADA
ncbi:MAG: IS1380 family transposase, partial [Actinomycetia bacterium]|nr:IS1380 family transposase [Actinomycetes bacterium]